MTKEDGNLSIFLRLVRELSSISPRMFWLMYFCFAADGLVFTLLVGIKERVFDSAIGFYVERADLAQTVFCTVAMFTLYVLSSVLNALGNCCAEVYDVKAIRYMHQKIAEKSGRIPAVQYEDPVFLDRVEKAYSGANAGMAYLNSVMDLVFMYSLFVAFMAIYLWSKQPVLVLIIFLIFWSKQPVLVLIIFLIFLPTVYAQQVKRKRYRKLEQKNV
ncbi:MAG: ABC transporter ATP-binding protein [Firmicutes bacterium]|nr:ABC transporter ATP-binding protein [Candidatus Fermentithermobacillaceae bacterium]